VQQRQVEAIGPGGGSVNDQVSIITAEDYNATRKRSSFKSIKTRLFLGLRDAPPDSWGCSDKSCKGICIGQAKDPVLICPCDVASTMEIG
jgi:hypothetical protein